MPADESLDSRMAAIDSLQAKDGSTSSNLVLRAKSRDAAAWKQLVEAYGPLVVHWCGRWSLSPEDASDIVQEVFIAVSRNLAQFQLDPPRGTFRGWLLTITQNKIRDLHRRRIHQPPAVGGSEYKGFLAEIPEAAESLDQAPAGERTALVRNALDLVRSEFEPRTWQAFWQSAVESRSAADVGQELGMTSVAVRKAKSRVLRRLRMELESLAS